MLIFIISFVVCLNLLSIFLMFDIKFKKRTYKVGHADVKFYFSNNSYNPKPCLKVSIERESRFASRHYKCEVKIIREFEDDTCEVKLIKCFVDHEDINKLMGSKCILDKKDINFKI